MASDDEFVFLLKDCVRINQFERFSLDELEHAYTRGSALSESRPDDIQLLQAVLVLRANIHDRIKASSQYTEPTIEEEGPKPKSRSIVSIIVAIMFSLLILGLIMDCGNRTIRALDAFFYDAEKYD